MSKSFASTSFAASFAGALRVAGISKSELARRVGCNRGRISGYVSGRKVPRRGMLDRINAVLGSELAPERHITINDFARDMGIGVETARRGVKLGAGTLPEIGVAIPSKTGKRHTFRFYPEKYKGWINANA